MKKRTIILTLLSIILAVGLLYYGIDIASRSDEASDKKRVEDSINSAVIKCYSIEGKYPESIDYLTKNYGLVYNHNKYQIHYILEGSNMRPDIKVFVKEE